ncbi:hypothetical protein MEA186_01181 [Mesorhizobium amorphae CCNWGS0123]|uniref:Uncharacterized protein n=1 Tax=Mesorhizobium amorphae CCNWGS0123 TaxID=1082933 RepID=G6Y2Y3_9HYPH|nr:hypothetical protein A6B35_31100 [Mesorhizobium amorphae CCNWGS0123]EHH13899.1 hypothetical protein MEA186_01181 [Mesorhizobium amorphae CCNWGS0123]
MRARLRALEPATLLTPLAFSIDPDLLIKDSVPRATTDLSILNPLSAGRFEAHPIPQGSALSRLANEDDFIPSHKRVSAVSNVRQCRLRDMAVPNYHLRRTVF